MTDKPRITLDAKSWQEASPPAGAGSQATRTPILMRASKLSHGIRG
jgi:hypothetical protein